MTWVGYMSQVEYMKTKNLTSTDSNFLYRWVASWACAWGSVFCHLWRSFTGSPTGWSGMPLTRGLTNEW